MEITTVRQNFGKKVNVSIEGKAIELEFAGNGICKIKDEEISGKILAKYPEMFFDPKEVKKESPKVPVQQENLVRNLQEKIVSLESNIASLKTEVEVAKADKEEWAKLAEEAQKKSELDNGNTANIQAAMESMKNFYELKIHLMESTIPLMKELCVKSAFPKNEWHDLDRNDLIEYILEKSK